jgi:hypothetical protein
MHLHGYVEDKFFGDSEKEQLDSMDACFNTTHWHDVIRLT